MFRKALIACLTLLSIAGAAGAEEAPMFMSEQPLVAQRSFPPSPGIARRAGLTPAATLLASATTVPEQIDAVRMWNEQNRVPQRNGFIRSFGETMDVQIGAAVAGNRGTFARGVLDTSERGVVWATSYRVEEAARLRVHLENVSLPSGAVLWVYGESGAPIAFDASLIDDRGSLWTPSVNGDTLYLELEIPFPKSAAEGVSFKVREVLELMYRRDALKPKTDDAPTCLVNQDVTCKTTAEFPALVAASAATGQMEFVVPGGGAVCTGTLITDRAQSRTPYFLTANHCLDSQSAASSLETYFDFKFESCISSNYNFLPPVSGATLLATGDLSRSDYTLLRLSSVPANRVFLGWTTAPVANGTRLHRISHPVPDGLPGAQPQIYSRTIVKTPNTNPQCSSIRPPNFIFSNESNGGVGGVYGGSSGSAIMLDNGQIVGQLLGSCGGIDPQAGCDRNNDTLDGAFAATYPFIKQYIDPTPAPVPARRRAVRR